MIIIFHYLKKTYSYDEKIIDNWHFNMSILYQNIKIELERCFKFFLKDYPKAKL